MKHKKTGLTELFSFFAAGVTIYQGVTHGVIDPIAFEAATAEVEIVAVAIISSLAAAVRVAYKKARKFDDVGIEKLKKSEDS